MTDAIIAAFGKFNPDLHPRGKDGKFIVKFGSILALLDRLDNGTSLTDGGGERNFRGKVVAITPDPKSPGNPDIKMEVYSPDGKSLGFATVKPNKVSAAKEAKARLDVAELSPVPEVGMSTYVAPERTESPRKGLGDVTLSDKDFEALKSGSAGQYVTGRNPDGSPIFTPERQALHDKWIADQLEGVPESKDPTFYMLGGGPAAGKSTMLNAGSVDVPDPDSRQAAVINADEAKAALPEYQDMVARGDADAATFAHEESSYLAKRLQAAAIERKVDFVLDGTGNSDAAKLRGKIEAAREKGYKVKGFYATVPTDVAVARSDKRGEKEGRVVPEKVIRATHISVSGVFEDAATDFDEVQLFDTTEGARPIARATRGGQIEVLDEQAYAAFIEKKNESPFKRNASDVTGDVTDVLGHGTEDPVALKSILEDSKTALQDQGLTGDDLRNAMISDVSTKYSDATGVDIADDEIGDLVDAELAGRLTAGPDYNLLGRTADVKDPQALYKILSDRYDTKAATATYDLSTPEGKSKFDNEVRMNLVNQAGYEYAQKTGEVEPSAETMRSVAALFLRGDIDGKERTGAKVPAPEVSDTQRKYNDLKAKRDDLEGIVTDAIMRGNTQDQFDAEDELAQVEADIKQFEADNPDVVSAPAETPRVLTPDQDTALQIARLESQLKDVEDKIFSPTFATTNEVGQNNLLKERRDLMDLIDSKKNEPAKFETPPDFGKPPGGAFDRLMREESQPVQNLRPPQRRTAERMVDHFNENADPKTLQFFEDAVDKGADSRSATKAWRAFEADVEDFKATDERSFGERIDEDTKRTAFNQLIFEASSRKAKKMSDEELKKEAERAENECMLPWFAPAGTIASGDMYEGEMIPIVAATCSNPYRDALNDELASRGIGGDAGAGWSKETTEGTDFVSTKTGPNGLTARVSESFYSVAKGNNMITADVVNADGNPVVQLGLSQIDAALDGEPATKEKVQEIAGKAMQALADAGIDTPYSVKLGYAEKRKRWRIVEEALGIPQPDPAPSGLSEDEIDNAVESMIAEWDKTRKRSTVKDPYKRRVADLKATNQQQKKFDAGLRDGSIKPPGKDTGDASGSSASEAQVLDFAAQSQLRTSQPFVDTDGSPALDQLELIRALFGKSSSTSVSDHYSLVREYNKRNSDNPITHAEYVNAVNRVPGYVPEEDFRDYVNRLISKGLLTFAPPDAPDAGRVRDTDNGIRAVKRDAAVPSGAMEPTGLPGEMKWDALPDKVKAPGAPGTDADLAEMVKRYEAANGKKPSAAQIEKLKKNLESGKTKVPPAATSKVAPVTPPGSKPARNWANTWLNASELDSYIADLEPDERLREFDYNATIPRSPSLPSRLKKMSDDDLKSTFEQVEKSRAAGSFDTSADTERDLKIEMARRGLLTETDTKAAKPAAKKAATKKAPASKAVSPVTGRGKVVDKPGPNSGVRVDDNPDSPWKGTITVDHGSTTADVNEKTGVFTWKDEGKEVTSWSVETIGGKWPTGAKGKKDAEEVWAAREAISNLMEDYYDSPAAKPGMKKKRNARLRVTKNADGGWVISLYDSQGEVGTVNADGTWSLASAPAAKPKQGKAAMASEVLSKQLKAKADQAALDRANK